MITEDGSDEWKGLGALGGDFGWALRSVSLAFQTRAQDAVRDIPQGPRGYLVLLAVSEGEAPSQLQLAQRLGIDKTQMTYVIDALETDALVSRVPDPSDRRARLIRITASGRRAVSSAQAVITGVEKTLLGVLGARDEATFRRALSRVALTLTTPPPPPVE